MGTPVERPHEEPGEPTRTDWTIFGAGLLAYCLGFVLLGHDHPDVAPAVIVAGIVAMLRAFLF